MSEPVDPQRAINAGAQLIADAILRLGAVQALMLADLLAGRPTREIADYARQLGYAAEQPEDGGL